jgi:Zn-dependent protease with chaperone function
MDREELTQAAAAQVVLGVLFSFSNMNVLAMLCVAALAAALALYRKPDVQGYRSDTSVLEKVQQHAALLGVRVEQTFLNHRDPYNATWHRTGRQRGVVVLGEGLLADDTCMEAALLHELGHAKQFLGLSSVLHSCARFAVPSIIGSQLGLRGLLLVPLGFVVVESAAAKHYRTREIRADRFAVEHGASREALLRYMTDAPQGVVERAVSSHPVLAERRAALGLLARAS